MAGAAGALLGSSVAPYLGIDLAAGAVAGGALSASIASPSSSVSFTDMLNRM